MAPEMSPANAGRRLALRARKRDSPAPPDGSTAERVVLLHIRKTGASSLSELLRRWAGPSMARIGLRLDDLALMPKTVLTRLRAVSGTFPFEALSLIPDPFTTATILRDPVDRTLSHYREIARTHNGGQDLTLDEFLHSERFALQAGNYQAHFLSHRIDIPGAWNDYSPMERYLEVGGVPEEPHPLQALFGSTPSQLTEDELFAQASANLSAVDFVGTTDNLDLLAGRLAEAFGARREVAPRLNTSETGAGRDLPLTLRRRIERLTAVDRHLYELAGELSARLAVKQP